MLKDYIEKLQLPLQGEYEGDNKYKISFNSSDMYERFYLILSRYDFLNFEEELSSISLFDTTCCWSDPESGIQITLVANYEKDIYECIVEAVNATDQE